MARPTRAQAAAIEAAKAVDDAAAAFGDRELDVKMDSGRSNERGEWQKHKDRRALFQFRDGTYSTGVKYNDSGGVSREKAVIKTVNEWYDITSWYNDTYLEILLDKPKEPPKPREDGTLSYLSDHFDDSFIGLIQDAPNNPTIRGFIMKKLKVMPESSLDTFDKLREWIEKTFPIPEIKSVIKKGKARSASNGDPEVSIKFDYSDVESGRCRYRVSRYGDRVVSFTLSELRDCIYDEGLGKQDLIDRLISNAREGDYPEMEWSDDGPNYEEHDSQDNSDSTTNPAMGEKVMLETIVEFLNRYAPELVEQLNEN